MAPSAVFDVKKLSLGTLAAIGSDAAPLGQRLVVAAGGASNVTATFLYGVNATVAGGTISSWADANGGSPALIQATGANQPTDNGTEYVFDATTKHLIGAFTFNGPQTIFAVVKQNTWVNNLYFFDGNTVDTGALFQKGVTPQNQMYQGAFFAPGAGPTVGTWVVLTLMFNGASSSYQINDNAPVTGNAGTVKNMAGLALGGVAAASAANVSWRGALLCPTVSLTAGQLQAVHNLLYAAYGVTP